MKLHIVNFDTWEEYDASSLIECRDENAQRLWQMHLEIPSEEWKIGRTMAIKLED